MIKPTEAAELLEEYATRLERGGHELWHGESRATRRDATAFREIGAQFRRMLQVARFRPSYIGLLERHAAELRRINEPLQRRDVAEATRREAILAVGIAGQLELISTWISRMTGEWSET